MKTEKPTPVYICECALAGVAGYPYYCRPEKRDRHGQRQAGELSRGKALQGMAECQAEGIPARVRHYGFRERGFRAGEYPEKVEAENGAWRQWRESEAAK